MTDTAIERKTDNTAGTKVAAPATPTVSQSSKKNVLHRYRSANYVFTLSGLRKTDANNPKSYRDSTLDLVILRSGGKGPIGLSAPVSSGTDSPNSTEAEKAKRAETAKKQLESQELVNLFNEKSPGRFDMYIDNVEINSVMGFNQSGMNSQPTGFTFDVVEPYSINGFIEALHVAAIGAGYPTYTAGSFLLKMEFIGYPDDQEFSKPEVVEDAVRYFPIRLTGIDVTVDEKGTKYQVTAIPYNEAAFGNPSQLKKSVKMAGKTVKEILENLMAGVNKQIVESDNASKKTPPTADEHDVYKIKFPDWVDGTGFDDAKVNKIGQAEVAELLKDNTLYKFPDPGTNVKPTTAKPQGQQTPTPEQNARQPETYKLEPSNPVVQFAEGRNIQECITSIIRDSKYVRNIMEKLSSESEAEQVKDADGMVDYFLVKLEVENKEIIDNDKKRPYQIFTFVVTPYKILYTRIPGYGRQTLDATKLKKLSLREYNYIYTGKNVDIVNFKLNFNTLFFEAIPAALGNNKAPGSRDGAGKSNKPDPKSNPDDVSKAKRLGLPEAPIQEDPALTAHPKDRGNQRQDDPYSALAMSMHNAVVNSKGSMLSGELDILGDPLFVVTGGIGNYNPAPNKTNDRLTDQGEAAYNRGEVLITINFRNPVDEGTLEQGGRLLFDSKLVPFSGVYMVTKVKSTFRDGLFKQTMDVIRVPGQPEPTENPTNQGVDKPTKPTSVRSQQSDPYDTVTADTTPADTVVNTDTGISGDRADTINLATQLDRGLPSPGLPGRLSNFTGATGGLAGAISPLSNVSGATPNLAGNTRIATQIFGGVVPGGNNQWASGIPLPAKSVSAVQQRAFGPASLIAQIGNTIATGGIKGPVAQLAGQVINIAAGKITKIGVLGSGIGAGATVSYNPSTSAPTSAYEYRSQQQSVIPTATPVTGIAQGLDTKSLSAVAGLPNNADLVGDVGSKSYAATQGTPVDPLATANQFGINQSQLSGLSPNLQSKVLSQVSGIASNVPADTNLSQASAQGINLRSMSPAGLANLPPTAPYATAPNPEPDQGFLNKITSSGGVSALARAFGVNSVSEISQNQVPSENINSAISSAPTAVQNTQQSALQPNLMDSVAGALKYLTSNNQLVNLTGLAGTREGQLLAIQNRYPGSPINVVGNLGSSAPSKFGSKTSGQSPLDKIMIR